MEEEDCCRAASASTSACCFFVRLPSSVDLGVVVPFALGVVDGFGFVEFLLGVPVYIVLSFEGFEGVLRLGLLFDFLTEMAVWPDGLLLLFWGAFFRSLANRFTTASLSSSPDSSDSFCGVFCNSASSSSCLRFLFARRFLGVLLDDGVVGPAEFGFDPAGDEVDVVGLVVFSSA